MKFKTLVIIFLCFSKNLIAQDTLRVETVVDSAFKTPQYVAAFDDVFLSHQETQWLLKMDFMGLLLNKTPHFNDFIFWQALDSPPPGKQMVSLSFERKITTSLSVNTQISSFNNFLDKGSPFSNMIWAWAIEPRYYFRKKTEIKNNKSANNLNGNYFSVGISKENKSHIFRWSANYGFQKRVFNNWYIDYKLGLGFYKADRVVRSEANLFAYTVRRDINQLEMINQFALGYTFGEGKHKSVSTCDIFRCFETEKSLWKTDIRHILNIKPQKFSSNLMIGYEHKLGRSAWSLNTDLKSEVNNFSDPRSDLTAKIARLSATVEPRYYYDLKKRISKGLSVNNLSGCYVSLALGVGNGKENWRLVEPETLVTTKEIKAGIKTQQLTIMPKWGIQKRIFQYGFVDFSLTPTFFKMTTYQIDAQPKIKTTFWQYSTIGKIPIPIADFKIGFAF